MKKKLKHCPFCGGEAVIFQRLVPRVSNNKKQILWEIGCQDSFCVCWIPPRGLEQSGDGYVFKKEALSSWQRRAI